MPSARGGRRLARYGNGAVQLPIFDDLLEGEYWEYENNGLRFAQIRFYDCSTNVETGASTCAY